jgi:hypothetical protein
MKAASCAQRRRRSRNPATAGEPVVCLPDRALSLTRVLRSAGRTSRGRRSTRPGARSAWSAWAAASRVDARRRPGPRRLCTTRASAADEMPVERHAARAVACLRGSVASVRRHRAFVQADRAQARDDVAVAEAGCGRSACAGPVARGTATVHRGRRGESRHHQLPLTVTAAAGASQHSTHTERPSQPHGRVTQQGQVQCVYSSCGNRRAWLPAAERMGAR